MIVGVEQTTDRRDAQTKIIVHSTEKAAVKWINEAPNARAFADDGNAHRRIRTAYFLPGGFRPHKRAMDQHVANNRGSVYRQSYDDAKAMICRRYGEEIPH